MATATLGLERVTPNVYTTTKLRGCNPSFVTTSDGVVAIDTPQLPTRAVAMRTEAESHGPIRYLINTEHHVDHIFGNYWFKGVPVVNHQGLYDNFMDPNAELDPFAYALEAIPTDDPEATPLIPDRDVYYQDPNRGTIVFTGDLTLRVGDHTFHLLHTPGHTPGQLAVHVPDVERRPVARSTRADPRTGRRSFDPRSRPRPAARLREYPAKRVARLESGGRRCRRQGLGPGGDRRPRPLRRGVRPGRRRAGLHDGSHPDKERGLALG